MSKTENDEVIDKLYDAIDSYKEEIRRLRSEVTRAEDKAAKWRRKAKKLKKRESTVIAEAAPELLGLPDLGDVLSA